MQAFVGETFVIQEYIMTDATLSMLEATNARIQQMDAKLTQRLDNVAEVLESVGSKLDALAVQQEALLGAIQLTNRGLDRVATAWEEQTKLMAQAMENQLAMVNTQSQMMTQLARMVERVMSQSTAS